MRWDHLFNLEYFHLQTQTKRCNENMNVVLQNYHRMRSWWRLKGLAQCKSSSFGSMETLPHPDRQTDEIKTIGVWPWEERLQEQKEPPRLTRTDSVLYQLVILSSSEVWILWKMIFFSFLGTKYLIGCGLVTLEQKNLKGPSSSLFL